jgi:nitrate/TMAO reductase-like tetraheme cytochrome c subunit
MTGERSSGVRNRRLVRGSRSRAAVSLALGIAFAGLMALGLATWLYATPASAATTTTESPAATSATPYVDSTGTLVDPAVSPVPTTVVPSVGPALGLDPTAPRTYVDQNNCLSCHGDASLTPIMAEQRPDGSSVALYVDPKGLEYSVHRFSDCTTCHSSKPHDVKSPLTKLSLAEKCGSCHQFEYGQYIKSVHGAPQTSGNSDPATCTDCHSSNSNPHNIVRVLDPAASTYPKNIAETCARCHDNPELMGKYGIVEKVYDSYMRSFHGKAISLSGESAALQQLDKATCINCHGSHNISLVTNPDSPVAGMENLAKTCEQCHPGAGVEFAKGFLGHKEAEPNHIPQVFWGERFFYVFTRVVLAGGVVLVVAPFWRSGVDRIKRRRKPPKKEE